MTDEQHPIDDAESTRSRVIFERTTGGSLGTVDGNVRTILEQDAYVWIDDAVLDGKYAFPLMLINTRRVVSIAMGGDES